MADLAIIGGGPAGYVAAERAGAAGLSVILFEKNALGGVCLNEGCIPTKTLLYSAKTYDNVLHANLYGVTTTGVEFDYAKMVARKNKVVRKLTAGVAAKMRAHNVTVVSGAATILGRTPRGFEIECPGNSDTTSGTSSSPGNNPADLYTASDLLICTGSEPFLPPIPGLRESYSASSSASSESTSTVVTARELLALKERPTGLVIIGGGVIGMEFASLYSTLGTKVTVIEMLPEILPGFDAEISAMLREVLTKKHVDFRLGSRVTKIVGNRVIYTSGSDPESITEGEIEGDRILVSIGRRPVTQGFGLENIGVELTPGGGIKTDEKMRTNVPGVYAAGDVTGFSMLAHTASREAEAAVNNLIGRPDTMHYNAVPGVIYTNPEVASVGLTLEAALAQGIADARELKLPMAYSGRFTAENEGAVGLCKIVVSKHVTDKHTTVDTTDMTNATDSDARVLGVHLLGNPAGEIIWGAAQAIENRMTLSELRRIIFPHPTVSEIIRETAFL